MNRRDLTTSMLVATAAGSALPGLLRAQTPAAIPVSSGAIRYADVPGVALALSPDGTMLAGVVDRERFGIWDTETFATVAESGPLDEISILDELSVAWSPDSTAVAWSLDAARLLRDSDIYVFDVDTGTITNLTDDEPMDRDAVRLPLGGGDGEPLDVDLYPSWSADSESLYFARTVWKDAPELATSLWRISRDGTGATEIAELAPDQPFLVSSIRAGSEDGSVLYATWPPRNDGPDHGVFLATPDGEIEPISTGLLAATTPAMVLTSIAPEARKASLVSFVNIAQLDNPTGPIWIEMDLDTGIPTAFEEVLSLPTGGSQDPVLLGAPAFLTDPDGSLTGYLYATANFTSGVSTLWRHDAATGESWSIGAVLDDTDPRSTRQIDRVEVGANGTAAILYRGNAWLASIGD